MSQYLYLQSQYVFCLSLSEEHHLFDISSTVSPTACALDLQKVHLKSPIPLVKLDSVVPDIVPDIISFAILTVTVPDDGKFVADAND